MLKHENVGIYKDVLMAILLAAKTWTKSQSVLESISKREMVISARNKFYYCNPLKIFAKVDYDARKQGVHYSEIRDLGEYN